MVQRGSIPDRGDFGRFNGDDALRRDLENQIRPDIDMLVDQAEIAFGHAFRRGDAGIVVSRFDNVGFFTRCHLGTIRPAGRGRDGGNGCLLPGLRRLRLVGRPAVQEFLVHENQPDRHDVDQENNRQRAGDFRTAIVRIHLRGGGRRDALFAVAGDGAQASENPFRHGAAFDRQGVGFHGN